MRQTLTLLILLLLFVSFKGTAPKKFSIKIKEYDHQNSKDFSITVTNDSIVGREMDYQNNEESGFDNGLTSAQCGKISDALSGVDLNTLQESYVDDNAPAEQTEFDFTITKEDVTKQIHIYEMPVEGLLNLTKVINVYLPKDMQVGYNEEYLKKHMR